MIVALTEDSKNDAKGSAGISMRALSMMHIEQEKLNNKLREVVTQKQYWIKLTPIIAGTI
jgi:hypothetical protein